MNKEALSETEDTVKSDKPPFFKKIYLWFLSGFIILVLGIILAFFIFKKDKPEEEDSAFAAFDQSEEERGIRGLCQLPLMEISLKADDDLYLTLFLGIALISSDGPEAELRLLSDQENILKEIRLYVERLGLEGLKGGRGKLGLKYGLRKRLSELTGQTLMLYITDYILLLPI